MSSISIIIPVYNAEKYLRRCINSIYAQTYDDFELLLVDDGSSDSSGRICDEYAATDSRTRVFHNENQGVSSARNTGLDNAVGEWIMFMDSDDFWCDDNILKELHETAVRTEADIVRGEYKSVDADGNDQEISSTGEKTGLENRILSPWEFLDKAIAGEFFLVLCLIRRRSIGKLRFDVNKVFLEDAEFFLSLLSGNLRCVYLNKVFYAYRKHSGSASNSADIKRLGDSFDMCDFYWEMAKTASDANIRRMCMHKSVMTYYLTLQTLASEPYYSNRTKIIEVLQLNDVHERVKSRIKHCSIGWKYRPFIETKPCFGVRILHFKDKLRLILQ